MAAIMNGKYTNAMPFSRVEKELEANGIKITRQNMANWIINCSDKYLKPLVDRLITEMQKHPVNQSDETPVQVIHDNDPEDPNGTKRAAGHKNYMWVSRTGEFVKDKPVIIYQYHRGRSHEYPLEFYRNYHGVLVTDGLEQYHKIAGMLKDLETANCRAHARRDFADAVKAIGTKNTKAIQESTAYKALAQISALYNIEEQIKDKSVKERLRVRQEKSKPLVDVYFPWVKTTLADTKVLPKGKTADGLNYSINQDPYLRAYLENGDIPIDNSACERAIRPFTVGRKNWMFINTVKGAEASATVYSVVETAKANNPNVYKYLFTELPKYRDENGNIDPSKLDPLLPWAAELPESVHKPRR